jgi:prepilin-type N-terminal cleavage/methylation domain-containing protein
MSKGFTLLELMVVVCIAAVLLALGFPRAARFLDWVETELAVRDVTTALAVGRNGAVVQSTRTRITIDPDTLRIDRFGAQGWERFWRTPGPSSRRVALVISNPVVIFGPSGMAWGASNTTVALRRGSQAETITLSRVGRVKIW